MAKKAASKQKKRTTKPVNKKAPKKAGVERKTGGKKGGGKTQPGQAPPFARAASVPLEVSGVTALTAPNLKRNAVEDAVRAQLVTETRWPPNDITKVMSADYHYSPQSIFGFLVAVRERLRAHVPPYQFSFDQGFLQGALAAKVVALMAMIDGHTA